MQMLLLLVCCTAVVSGNSKFVEWFTQKQSHDVKTSFSSYYHEWLVFKNKHGKVYEDMDTDQRRYETFKTNLQYIEKHNKLYNTGQKSYYLGINMYADMTHQEFKDVMRLERLMQHKSQGASSFLLPSSVSLPDTVDWRDKGLVTPVKNQGQCGSCWSFSTTGSLEGQHFKQTGKLISLSEQQLVDCSGKYGDHGCDGGLMDYAFDYIKDKGSESETAYPYHAKQSECKYNSSEVVANCSGYTDIKSGSESDLQTAVATVGPVSVAIDASQKSFQLYSGGVYDEPDCSSTKLDHGVLAVGYGTDSDTDYWLVKNSWGESWGDNGYVKMSRNKDNQCGIATSASYPLV